MIKVSIAVCNLSVSKVVANSRATAEAFERAGGNKNLVSLVYNGVLSDAFFLAPQLRAPDSLIVGCFARLTPWKGQHILLRSMAYLPGVRVRIVGSALFGEDEYEAELRQIARELGITERVEFLGFREDVPALMKSVDVVAHTSVSPEPFGRVIIEAAYAGRPIVAARGGAVDELLEHGSTGFLVEPNNPAALAEQIDEVWRNWPVAYAVALEAQRQALQRFSVPTMITDLSNLVNSLPGSRRL